MKEDYIARSFQKIDDDLTFLMNCFREVLEELGEHYLASNLPWINQVKVDAEPNPRFCQAGMLIVRCWGWKASLIFSVRRLPLTRWS
jgi:hypothetical protein